MWGGVKRRVHAAELVRNFSNTKGPETLRRQLYTEPRPWFVGWSLHEGHHRMNDFTSAKLLQWCAAVTLLEPQYAQRAEHYRSGFELCRVIHNHHDMKSSAWNACFRLLEVGGDLEAAYQWIELRLKSGGAHELGHYVWLLRVAQSCPNDELVEEMVDAVREVYQVHFCTIFEHVATKERVLLDFDPAMEDDRVYLAKLFQLFRALKPRISDRELRSWIDATPTLDVDEEKYFTIVRAEAVLPHLENGQPVATPTVRQPRLRDSLLDCSFEMELQDAAFAGDAHRTAQLVECVVNELQREKESIEQNKRFDRPTGGKRPIWRHYRNTSASMFRYRLVESVGVTPELYHYLIVSLVDTAPSTALALKEKVMQCGLRLLDLTRAVLICRLENAEEQQAQLLKEQLEAVTYREKLDGENIHCKAIESYWKYDHVLLQNYLNALSMSAFYSLLIDELGPEKTQSLILSSKIHGEKIALEDVVAIDDHFRDALAKYFRTVRGKGPIDSALDRIGDVFPQLDIALTNSIPGFEDHCLSAECDICTTTAELKRRFTGAKRIAVLDTSFLEVRRDFWRVGQHDESHEKSALIVPYFVLRALHEGMDTTCPCTITVALDGKSAAHAERQRLNYRSVLNTVKECVDSGAVQLLYHSECMLAQMVPSEFPLDPTQDNDLFTSVIAMLSCLLPDSTIVACTEDSNLAERIKQTAARGLLQPNVLILTGGSDHEVQAKGPSTGTLDSLSQGFEPIITPDERRGLQHRFLLLCLNLIKRCLNHFAFGGES